MSHRIAPVLLLAFITTATVSRAQTLDSEMANLAGRISKALVSQGFKNAAAIDFTDLQGQPIELGRFLSERLAVEIVSAGGITMLDRGNIKSILAEHKLTQEGLVNAANAKKLGEFAGVHVIMIGNVTALDAGIELMVKAISTESAAIVAAGRVAFPMTSDMLQLLNRGVSSSSVPRIPTSTRDSALSYKEAGAITSKDIGSLRIILKSVTPVRSTDGRALASIRYTFEFINLETQRPLMVAMNAQAPGNVAKSMAPWLRSSLIDDRGGVWNLSAQGTTGIGVVGVGSQGVFYPYNAAEIAALLARRDELNSNTALGRTGDQNQFLFGETSAIAPGKSARVVLSFTAAARPTAGWSPKSFESSIEIVTGLASPNGKTVYSLHALAFDRVVLATP